MSFPHSDSCAFRSLILKGRVSALHELAGLLAIHERALNAAAPTHRLALLDEHRRQLLAWTLDAAWEASQELVLMTDPLDAGR